MEKFSRLKSAKTSETDQQQVNQPRGQIVDLDHGEKIRYLNSQTREVDTVELEILN